MPVRWIEGDTFGESNVFDKSSSVSRSLGVDGNVVDDSASGDGVLTRECVCLGLFRE